MDPSMPRRPAGLAAALALPLLAAPLAGQAPDRPNIVFLFSDDHAAHALSAYREHLQYGARLPDTPNLDRLASEGMLFTHAFVTNSICAPSRATVLTGQYGHLNGVMTNAGALHPTHTTFPSLLQDAGYETAVFGKWHLKEAPSGFDHYEVLEGQGPYYNPVLLSPEDTTSYEGSTTEIVADRAAEWLGDRGRDVPFLAMVHFNAAHRYWDPGPDELVLDRDTALAEPSTLRDDGSGRASPSREQEMELLLDLFDRDLKLEPPAGLTPEQRRLWEDAYGDENRAFRSREMGNEALLRWRYQRYIGDYMRTVAGLDRAVGRLLDHLDQAGLAESTLVVYTSDQGFFLGDHGWFDKRWMYEESLRTPLLVRWPGVVQAGAVEDAMVMNLDLAQTLLESAGTPAPASMQGRSLVPLLRGERPDDWREAIYYQYFAWPDWHMVRRQYGVRTDRYKLIHFYEVGEWELYDLARDPDELANVYGDPAYGDVVVRLKDELTRLRARYAVPARDPVPYTPFDPPPHLRRPGAGGERVDTAGSRWRPAPALPIIG
jgi:arylsulfatase A-like enzyme